MKKATIATLRNLMLAFLAASVWTANGLWAQGTGAADYDKNYTLAGLTVLGGE